MRPRPVRDEVPVLVIGIGGAVDVRHRVRIRVAGSLVSLVAVGALVALVGDVSGGAVGVGSFVINAGRGKGGGSGGEPVEVVIEILCDFGAVVASDVSYLCDIKILIIDSSSFIYLLANQHILLPC